MTILLTGAAGFIGYHTAEALLARGERVIGVDSLNDYYDPKLKKARLERLRGRDGFTFRQGDVADREAVAGIFVDHPDIDRIIHLAAQAGVRYSLVNPYAYTHANVEGQLVLLEAAKAHDRLRHFVYASSSSVYGANSKLPFSIDDRVDHPVSLYAATKRSGELLAHAYSHAFGVKTTGLRFFTVYGPWGRPDMAAYIFTRKILAGEPIEVFNHGDMRRDFTYVDDIVQGVIAAVDRVPEALDGKPPYALYNLGNHRSEQLTRFIEVLEDSLGVKAKTQLEPMQVGDVKETYADIGASRRDLGFEPATSIEDGIPRFIAWFREYHGV